MNSFQFTTTPILWIMFLKKVSCNGNYTSLSFNDSAMATSSSDAWFKTVAKLVTCIGVVEVKETIFNIVKKTPILPSIHYKHLQNYRKNNQDVHYHYQLNKMSIYRSYY